ncbi:MAG: fasciclin domain-containing protein [Phycisphaeraceae bacterium]|nr:fasciclin domain-containing protein [Phycisphaeraceae bacterium]
MLTTQKLMALSAGLCALCGVAGATPAANTLEGVAAAVAPTAEQDIIATAMSNKDFSTLVAAIKAADLVEPLQGAGPFTVFAPTNAAFAKIDPKALDDLLKNKPLLQGVLKYHVVSGRALAADVVKQSAWPTLGGQRIDVKAADGKVMIDNATVMATDIKCSNGVIHVIDTVIMPSTIDIVATAMQAGKFKTLCAAVEAAGLASTLRGEGPFTVFAPTDDAFAKLPAGTVENLLKPENKGRLVSLLTYHVVPGRVFSDKVVASGTLKTVQGGEIAITVKDGKAMADKATIVKTDIDAANGVIHVIDAVLMPAEPGGKPTR